MRLRPPRCRRWIWRRTNHDRVEESEVVAKASVVTSQQLPSDVTIARALEGLQDLDDRPVVEHVARFNAVHESLTSALSSIDEV